MNWDRARTGGPAFPATQYYDDKPVGQDEGMDLRDYFAAKAVGALLTEALRLDLESWDGTVRYAAKHAYEVADAMLKARRAS